MFKIVFASFVLSFFGLAGPALAEPAMAQACEMRAAMLGDGNEKPTEVAIRQFAWNTRMPPARVAAGLASLDTFDTVDADLFTAWRFGDYHHEYMLVVGLKQNSPVYIMLRYQTINGQQRLINVTFKDKLIELIPSLSPGIDLDPLQC